LEDEEEINTSELTKCKNGVRALIGAAMLSTKGVVVSAIMASYLLLNKGHRFHFSNDFETLFLDHHFDASDDITDFILTSNNNGTSTDAVFMIFIHSTTQREAKERKTCA